MKYKEKKKRPILKEKNQNKTERNMDMIQRLKSSYKVFKAAIIDMMTVTNRVKEYALPINTKIEILSEK